MRRALYAGVALATTTLTCCAPADSSNGPPRPADVAWVGAVRTDGVVTPRASPGLVPAGPERDVFAISSDDPWAVVGFRDVDLRDIGRPEAAELAADALEWGPSTMCGALPAPAWTVALTDEARAAVAAPFAVRTAWSRRCSEEGEARWVDVRCVSALSCGSELVQEGCSITAPDVACPTLRPMIEVERSGSACLASAEEMEGCSVSVRPDGGRRWRCAGCVVDGYRPQAPRDWGEVRVLPVGNAGRSMPNDFVFELVRSRHFEIGSLAALGVRGNTALVAPRRAESSGRCTEGADPQAGDLVRVDTDSGLVVGTATGAGRCFTRIIPDPVDDGFLATYLRGRALMLARLDLAGAVVSEVELQRPTPAALGYKGSLAFVVGSTTAVVVAESMLLDDQSRRSVIHAVDARTLTPLVDASQFEAAIVDVDWGDHSHRTIFVAQGDNNLDGVQLMPLTGGRARDARSVGGQTVTRAGLLLADGRHVVLEPRISYGALLVDLSAGFDLIRGIARPFEARAVAAEVLEVPDRGGLMASVLVALDDGLRWQAAVAMIEVGERDLRFLPGMLRLLDVDGQPLEGPLTQLAFDGRGRVWAMAPWSGRLVRFEKVPSVP